MKKLIMAIVCLMTMISANAQGFREKAIKEVIKEVRLSLKAPSTFVLTDAYGYKIPISKVSATFLKENVEYRTRVCGEYVHMIDSIDYFYTVDSVFVDSIVHTSYKQRKDSIVHIKVIYPVQYKVSFFYEAQNSLGGMTQRYAEYYVTRDNCVFSNIFNYEKIIKVEKNYNDSSTNKKVKKKYSYIYKPKKKAEKNNSCSINKAYFEEKEHYSKHINGIETPFYNCSHVYLHDVTIKGNTYNLKWKNNVCKLCKHELDELGEKYYKKLVKQRYIKYICSKEYKQKLKEKKNELKNKKKAEKTAKKIEKKRKEMLFNELLGK